METEAYPSGGSVNRRSAGLYRQSKLLLHVAERCEERTSRGV
jgi:hypothetical protein